MKNKVSKTIALFIMLSGVFALSAQKADIPEPKIIWKIKSNLKNFLSGSLEQTEDDSTFIINEIKFKGLKAEEINEIVVDVNTGDQLGKRKNDNYELGTGWEPLTVKKYKNYIVRENTFKFQVLRKDDNKKILDLKNLKILDWMLLEDNDILLTCQREIENKNRDRPAVTLLKLIKFIKFLTLFPSLAIKKIKSQVCPYRVWRFI